MTGNDRVKQPLELYLHIPFCIRKCNYCDFLSGPHDAASQKQYMEALLAELKGRSSECGDYEIKTVFFGGGTPSVAEGQWILRIMDQIRENYHLAKDAEITIEMNPGTVDEEKIRCYQRAGINRLSIGLQSADDTELKTLGRIHTYSDFLKTYDMARSAGFDNLNVDVMSALPGQTVDSYRRTLETLMGLPVIPEHISAYSLIIEEGTLFHSLHSQGKLVLPDEEEERQMYALTREILGAYGFRRYEISNYAREGYECIHNSGYWQRTEYLGLGVGSASLMKECRFSNGIDVKRYAKDPLTCRGELQKLPVEEQMEEFMFLGLRMARGVSASVFESTFGRKLTEVYGNVLQKNLQEGLMAVRNTDRTEHGSEEVSYYLTDKGMDVSNYVMAQFLF